MTAGQVPGPWTITVSLTIAACPGAILCGLHYRSEQTAHHAAATRSVHSLMKQRWWISIASSFGVLGDPKGIGRRPRKAACRNWPRPPAACRWGKLYVAGVLWHSLPMKLWRGVVCRPFALGVRARAQPSDKHLCSGRRCARLQKHARCNAPAPSRRRVQAAPAGIPGSTRKRWTVLDRARL